MRPSVLRGTLPVSSAGQPRPLLPAFLPPCSWQALPLKADAWGLRLIPETPPVLLSFISAKCISFLSLSLTVGGGGWQEGVMASPARPQAPKGGP